MAALDTNVIVRWLVKDDAAQTARVQTLLDARLRGQQTLFVPVTVASRQPPAASLSSHVPMNNLGLTGLRQTLHFQRPSQHHA